MSVSPESTGLKAPYIANAMKGAVGPKNLKAARNGGVTEWFTGTIDRNTLVAAQQHVRQYGGIFATATLTVSNDTGKRRCSVKIKL
jgi:hypothetical protein